MRLVQSRQRHKPSLTQVDAACVQIKHVLYKREFKSLNRTEYGQESGGIITHFTIDPLSYYVRHLCLCIGTDSEEAIFDFNQA